MMLLGNHRAKMMARDAWAGALGLIPLVWLQPLRNAGATAPEGTLRSSFLRALLEMVRYRKLDRSISTFALPDNPGLKLANTDSFIAQRVYWLGQRGYEGAEGSIWAGFCQEANGILEVGANIGFYTILGAKSAPGTPYIAIEPHPVNASILRQNLELNNLESIDVVEAAMVGHKSSDTIRLSIPDQDGYSNPLGGFLAEDAEGGDIPASRSLEVKVVEAREVVATNGCKIDLLKIDVEGHEYEILSTIEEWIERERPTMFIELWPKAHRLRQLLSEYCEKYDYRVFSTAEAEIKEAPKGALLDESFPLKLGNRDILLVSQSSPLSSNRQVAHATKRSA